MKNYIYTALAIASIILLISLFIKSKKSYDSIEYTTADGQKTNDINKLIPEGRVKFEIKGGDKIPEKANELHQLGRKFGSQGKMKEAIDSFNAAIILAPKWAYPRYDLAFTYQLEGNVDKALEEYLRVDEMEPNGFFTTKTAIWSLRNEKAGKFPQGTYSKYLKLEDIDNRKEKLMMALALTKLFPEYAPAWKECAVLTDEGDKALQYIEIGLANAPDKETEGVLRLNKASRLIEVGDKVGGKKYSTI